MSQEIAIYPKIPPWNFDKDFLLGKHLSIEEKLDGLQIGLSFNLNGEILIENRIGQPISNEESQFKILFQWVESHSKTLLNLLGTRYLLYGEWLYAKRSIFYDTLPHYLLELDVLDKEKSIFLSSLERKRMFSDTPVVSAPVLWNGVCTSNLGLEFLAGNSLFKSKKWKQRLEKILESTQLNKEKIYLETDFSNCMEGIIFKVEENNQVVERFKYTRPNFLRFISDNKNNQFIKNELNKDVQLLFR